MEEQTKYSVFGGDHVGDRLTMFATFTNPLTARALAMGLLFELDDRFRLRCPCYWVLEKDKYGNESAFCSYQNIDDLENDLASRFEVQDVG
jgi:hypothetical protein